MEDAEEWADVKGYEGIYQVSSHGRIRSLTRKVRASSGERTERGRMRKPHWTGNAMQIHLWNDGIGQAASLGQVVYTAFIGEVPKGWMVGHADKDASNNRWDNLVLGSHKTIRQKMVFKKVGGENSPCHRITRKDAWRIKYGDLAGLTGEEAAAAIGQTVTKSTVNDMRRGKTWKDLSKEESFDDTCS